MRLLPTSAAGKMVPQVEHSCKLCSAAVCCELPVAGICNLICWLLESKRDAILRTRRFTSQKIERQTEQTKPRSIARCTQAAALLSAKEGFYLKQALLAYLVAEAASSEVHSLSLRQHQEGAIVRVRRIDHLHQGEGHTP